jgi:hypothetical protein
MLPIIKYFLDICLFRANAEDAPSSQIFMIFTLTVYALLSVFIVMVDYSPAKAISTVLVGIAMMIGFAKAGLWIRNFMNRSSQTITALAGTGIIFDLINIPLVLLTSHFPAEELVFPRFLLLLILFWNITVIGHIMKNVLSIPFWAGVGISVFYALTYLRVVRVILSTGATTTVS